MSKVLYKYRGINDNTKDIFINNKVWYANIPSLNDPNEGLVKSITENNAKAFIRKTKEIQMSGFVTGLMIQKNNPEFKKLMRRISNLIGFERKYRFMVNWYKERGRKLSRAEGFLESIDTMLKKVGILSLSDNPLSTLMWSHYGDNHKGIAIGISNFNENAYKQVNYVKSTEVPEINLKEYNSVLRMYKDYNEFEISLDDPYLQLALQTKTEEWKYESEWRGVKEEFGLYSIEGEISEVVFGLNCSKKDRKEIKQIIQDKGIEGVLYKEVYREQDSYEFLIRDCK
ncbi:DUF2971 domain-containing protein (plasmid) [Bacillus mycoides]|uniref:DUF2971 domain-containing protein n=1 Tax=Bacillus mycoides TaxID=1405 RepID=UPI001C03979A|nr:DUF2971 domain-containing protein [Bacillus mycoides]QWG75804.1 DUF2971 domain-containing protein [Bacillus mycoides]QWH26187.1 DUF2971 domain-containing protein [Bacillus mycoides]